MRVSRQTLFCVGGNFSVHVLRLMGQSDPPVYRMFCLFLLRNIFCLFRLSVIYAHYKADKLTLKMLNLFEKINHFKYQPNFEKHDMDNTMWQYST